MTLQGLVSALKNEQICWRLLRPVRHSIPQSCDLFKGRGWQSRKGEEQTLNLMVIGGLIIYFFLNCTTTIFSQKLLYFYYFIPHSGQLQSSKKRNTCKHGHWEMNVLNPLHLRSAEVHYFLYNSTKYAFRKLPFSRMRRETTTDYKASRMGDWSELIMWRFIFCNRQLWARKWSLANRSNNSLEKIWSP